ncbi:energy transducer TonB [Occallatibacter riparius]|uniref:Energy transducer TonB n=1 Tax=Occallatibacter riparius TaxID=1002689 RepID=A0A9J7BIC4_9BACT|nr:energy transducer TonB [Occallatibacter riparius]UWZ82227.1 energy transducer TonB [Occallatibacter riparius]
MRPSRFRLIATASCKAAAFALLFALAIPARASDDRAVKQRVPPVYPELAKRMKITGEVTVEATVDPEGKVTDVKAISGSKTLSPAAEDAVRKWRFVPGPDVSHVDVSVKFEMAQ